MLTKVCHICKLQRQEESEYMSLHPELKEHVQEEKFKDEVKDKDDIPVQKRYIISYNIKSGKLQIAKLDYHFTNTLNKVSNQLKY